MILSIIDYGSGNLRSVAKAFGRAVSEAGSKIRVNVTSDPKKIATFCVSTSKTISHANN